MNFFQPFASQVSPPFAQTENRELIRFQQQLSRLSQNSAHTVQFLPLPSLKPSIFNLLNSNLQLYFLFTPRFSLRFLYSLPPLSVCPCQNIWSDTLADALDVNMFPPGSPECGGSLSVYSDWLFMFRVPSPGPLWPSDTFLQHARRPSLSRRAVNY